MITAGGGQLVMELAVGEGGKPPPSKSPPISGRVLTDAEVRRLEADNIRAALRAADGKVYGPGGAAELLGVKPTTLASRMKSLGLTRTVGGRDD
jgi:formate hydrogenlyase transcriptional activator